MFSMSCQLPVIFSNHPTSILSPCQPADPCVQYFYSSSLSLFYFLSNYLLHVVFFFFFLPDYILNHPHDHFTSTSLLLWFCYNRQFISVLFSACNIINAMYKAVFLWIFHRPLMWISVAIQERTEQFVFSQWVTWHISTHTLLTERLRSAISDGTW